MTPTRELGGGVTRVQVRLGPAMVDAELVRLGRGQSLLYLDRRRVLVGRVRARRGGFSWVMAGGAFRREVLAPSRRQAIAALVQAWDELQAQARTADYFRGSRAG